MSIELLTDRYAKLIAGTISCYDRMLLFGTLPQICYAEGMTSLLYSELLSKVVFCRLTQAAV